MGEVVDAMCCLIDNPEASLEELMEHIKGPDFPTGGIITVSYTHLDVYKRQGNTWMLRKPGVGRKPCSFLRQNIEIRENNRAAER